MAVISRSSASPSDPKCKPLAPSERIDIISFIMPRPRPPHLHRQKNRHGVVVWYVRFGKGPRIRINGTYGTPEFNRQYQEAINGEPVSWVHDDAIEL